MPMAAKRQLIVRPYAMPEMNLQNVSETNIDIIEPQIADNDVHYLIVASVFSAGMT